MAALRGAATTTGGGVGMASMVDDGYAGVADDCDDNDGIL
jgi:hypothetical protein